MPKNVVICDDDEDLVDLLASALEGAGFQVRFAYDCESVWPLISSVKPDFVLMDVRVPQMGGEAATLALKKQWGADLKIILISGESVLENIARQTRADGFLHKPFKIRTLVDLLKQV